MRKKIDCQEKAKELRSNGLSIIEIAKIVGSSKSSVSVWVRDVELTDGQINKLSRRLYKKIVECKGCGNTFERDTKNKRNIYCSFECYAKSRNRIILDNKKRERKKCQQCGKESRNIFCSSKCCIENHWDKRLKIAKDTGILPHRQGTAKIILLKMRPHQCEICKMIEWNGKSIPLVMDHINGNHKDNRIENLRLICGNCDMQLPTYKSKNRGNGRIYDRKYRKMEYHNKKGNVTEPGLLCRS